jgi:hypothetical protein
LAANASGPAVAAFGVDGDRLTGGGAPELLRLNKFISKINKNFMMNVKKQSIIYIFDLV